MRSSCLALGAAMVAAAGVAAGETGSLAPIELTITEAVDRALAQSEEIRLAREEITRAETQFTQVRAQALPQVTGSLRYNRTLRSIFDVEAAEPPDGDNDGDDAPFGDLPFGQPNTWNLALQLDQAIYSGGRLTSGLDIARRARRASEYGLSEAHSAVVRDVRQAYVQVLFTRSLVEISERAHAVANEQLELVESFEARGTASELDVLQARVERDNVEPQIVQAQNAARLAELELKRLLNISARRPLVLNSRVAQDFAVELSRDEVLEAALRRPSIRAARERTRIQEKTVELVRAERLPTVGAFADFSWQSFPDRILPRGLPGSDEWREDWVLGVQISIPIFEGLRVSGEIDEAQSELQTAVLEERQLREAVVLQTEAALGELAAAKAQIAARRATVREAERALELAELRYENGLARLIELSNARLLLQQAQVNEAEARVNLLSALAAVEYATGGELELFDEPASR